MIDPGRMNDRITLQAMGLVEHTYEGVVYTEEGYVDIATVWCQFRPTGGREFREGNIALGEERATFSIMYRENLTQVDRLIYQGKIWDIESVGRVGWKDGLDLNATTTGTPYEVTP